MKYIFCDLDNTLLFEENGKYFIKDNDLMALNKYYDRYKLIINSGRALSTIDLISNKFKGKPDCIGFNGLVILSNNEIIYNGYVDYLLIKEISEDIYKKFQGINIVTIDFSGKYYIYDLKLIQPLDRFKKQQSSKIITEISNKEKFIDAERKLSKILVYVGDYENKSMVYDYLINKYSNQLDFMFSSPIFIEGVCKGINKGYGIKKYLELNDLSKADCIAIGDADNDIEMFEFLYENSYCMIHGTNNAKYLVDSIEGALKIIYD